MNGHAILCLVLALAASGCATAARPAWLSTRPPGARPGDAASVAKKDQGSSKSEQETAKAESPKTAEKPATTEVAQADNKKAPPTAETNPFRKEGTADAAKTDVAATSATAPPTAKPAPTNGLNFSPEILALIESELRGASPDEQASWYEQLKKVDSAMVPELLRVRRLSVQIAERNTQTQETVKAATRWNQDRQAVDRGLGPVSPWDSSSPTVVPNVVAKPAILATGPIAQVHHQDLDGAAAGIVQAVGEFDSLQAAQAVQPVVHQPGKTSNALIPAGGLNADMTTAINPMPSDRGLPASAPLRRRGSNGAAELAGHMSGHSIPPRPMNTGFGQVQLASATPNTMSLPAPGAIGGTWKAGLEHVIASLETELAQARPGETPEAQHAYLERHVALRMLYLMADHPERALTAIPGIEPADQEFVQQLFWGVSNYLDNEHIPSDRDRAAQAISQLQNAISRLREKSDLEIHNLTFCRQIQYFGNYERFPRDEFRPGEELLLYAELQNFRSDPTTDGQYRTVLRSMIEILGPTGEVRWQKDFPATEDLCRTVRRDYFHNYQFAMPSTLPLGPHVLKLTVFDDLSGKMKSYSINFVVK